MVAAHWASFTHFLIRPVSATRMSSTRLLSSIRDGETRAIYRPVLLIAHLATVLLHLSILMKALKLLSQEGHTMHYVLTLLELVQLVYLACLSFSLGTQRLSLAELCDWFFVWQAMLSPAFHVVFSLTIPAASTPHWPSFLAVFMAVSVAAGEFPVAHLVGTWILTTPCFMWVTVRGTPVTVNFCELVHCHATGMTLHDVTLMFSFVS